MSGYDKSCRCQVIKSGREGFDKMMAHAIRNEVNYLGIRWQAKGRVKKNIVVTKFCISEM